MAVCRFCGRYHDIYEWPEQFRPAFVPHVCFNCFSEVPERADANHSAEDEEEEDDQE